MMKKYIVNNKKVLLLSFFIPIVIMVIVYCINGVYPLSDKTILASDSFGQLINFYASYKDVLLQKESILFSWNSSLGLSYLPLISYYLGGLLSPLVLFFPKILMPDFYYFLTLIKFGLSGLSFFIFADYTFKLHKSYSLAFAICYALMSFVVAHAELIMWLDTFIYLPMIILGLIQLIKKDKILVFFVFSALMFATNFYFGYMIGIFIILFFIFNYIANKKSSRKTIFLFIYSTICAVLASSFILLPTILDVRNNGETSNNLLNIFTENTKVFDIVVKNMIGIYDTTKYGSIPFIFIGLIPLIFCIYYTCSRKTNRRKKVAYFSIIVIIYLSFIFEPLNLFWQGMHAPNMFLYRYSFLFSFMCIFISIHGFKLFSNEKDKIQNVKLVNRIIYTLAFLFSSVFVFHDLLGYKYLKIENYLLTLFFLVIYYIIFNINMNKLKTRKLLV